MTSQKKRIQVELTVVGQDRKGIVAAVTECVFGAGGNIEKINQNVIRGLFGMHMEASFSPERLHLENFKTNLQQISRNFGMEIKAHVEDTSRPKRLAILVSHESHALETLLEARKKGTLRVEIPVIVSSDRSLKKVADRYKVPFYYFEHTHQLSAEEKILKLLEKYDIDFIALARYMRILSPNFVWRYPNRVINIHPSILPAFSGAYAYVQAHERGAQIIGCTAHFVTEDLDQGPIIWQESFRIRPDESFDSIRSRGRALESKTLLKAVGLYAKGLVEVYWGKVHFKRRGL